MRFLNTILLVLILIAVCTGGALLYFGKLGPTTTIALASDAGGNGTAEPNSPPPTPLFLALEPFTVTLQDERDIQQILYLEITVRIAQPSDRTYLIEYMPEVRNRILTELSKYTATRVQETQGRLALANQLRQTIGSPYPPRTDTPDVISVLFTAFVIQ